MIHRDENGYVYTIATMGEPGQLHDCTKGFLLSLCRSPTLIFHYQR